MNKYITWGEGGFSRDNWRVVYEFIKEFNVKSVLEYGCGVSTELLMAIGMDVLSLETQEEWAIASEAKIILVDYYNLPKLDRVFDFAFVDGPGAKEFEMKHIKPERKNSILHAMKYVKYIYMHDGGLGQIEPLEEDPLWTQYSKGGTDVGHSDVIYIKKDVDK